MRVCACNYVFTFRSVCDLVIVCANACTDERISNAVWVTDCTNTGIRSTVIPFDRIFITVVIKFTAPKIE